MIKNAKKEKMMATTKEQALAFIEKCEELKNCKFIMATSRIGDILKCIVNNAELYQLFMSVTENFDYPAAKRRCLVYYNDGVIDKSFVKLPDTIGERLAFIFCLLVEFDQNTINFNDFLQTYYAKEGSYYIGFKVFCDNVISSMQDMIREVFEEELNAPTVNVQQEQYMSNFPNPELSNLRSTVDVLMAQEKDYIQNYCVETEREAALLILNEVESAIKMGNIDLINALLTGYNYCLAVTNCYSPVCNELFDTIAKLEQYL